MTSVEEIAKKYKNMNGHHLHLIISHYEKGKGLYIAKDDWTGDYLLDSDRMSPTVISLIKEISILNNTWDIHKYELLKIILNIILKVYDSDHIKGNFKKELFYKYGWMNSLKYLLKVGNIDIHKDLGDEELTPYEHCVLLDIPIVTRLFNNYMC